MGFYGNSYAEFQKFFYNFIFKNEKDKNIFEIKPDSTYSALTLTGDKWISFSKEKENNTSIKISHILPLPEETKISKYLGLELLAEAPPEEEFDKITTLSAGAYIKIPAISCDERGHLQKVEYLQYRLPQTQSEIDYSNLMARTDILEKKGQVWDKNIETTSSLTDSLSKVNSLIGPFSKLGYGLTFTNLVEVLGPVLGENSYNKNLSTYCNEKQIVERSISEALSKIIESLGLMDTNHTIMKELYVGLLHRVEALEQKP